MRPYQFKGMSYLSTQQCGENQWFSHKSVKWKKRKIFVACSTKVFFLERAVFLVLFPWHWKIAISLYYILLGNLLCIYYLACRNDILETNFILICLPWNFSLTFIYHKAIVISKFEPNCELYTFVSKESTYNLYVI